MLTVGLALIADTVGEKKIGVTMAWISIQLNVGLMLGPLLGGIVYDKVGWYCTFSVGFGILALDLIMRAVIIEKSVAAQYHPAKLQADSRGNVSQLREEKRVSVVYRSKRLPEVIWLLKYPRMIAGLWLAFAQATIISAFDAALPLHLNRLFGWTSFQAGKEIVSKLILGLAYLAVAIPPFFIAPFSGWLSDTYTPKLPALIGMVAVIPFLLLLRLPTGTGVNDPLQEVFICMSVALLSKSKLCRMINSKISDSALSRRRHLARSHISQNSTEAENTGKHMRSSTWRSLAGFW